LEWIFSALKALTDIFMADPWAQLIGIVALIIGISAFLQKSDYLLRRNLTIFTLLMGFHFLLLGLLSGATTAWLGTLRTYISMRTRNLWVMTGFLVIVAAAAIPNVTGFVDFLPILGTSFGTWAMFRESGLRMRFLMLLGTLCWLAHNFWAGSIGGTIIETIFLIVNCHTMVSLMRNGDLENK
jgi:hypothetical protein